MLRLLLSLLLLFGIASARAEVRLLTSIKPLQLIAAAVQDGLGQPEVLLPPGASPHTFALRPSAIRLVQDAQLLYWIGPEMETFLPGVLAERSQPSVALVGLPGMQLRYFGAEQQGQEAHDADSASAAHDHDHDHRPGTLDAHLWLSPINAKVIAARMAADLARLEPANSERYQANLQAFNQRLDALDQRLRVSLVGLAGKPYFVFHEAYDYFEATYGLQHAGVFSLNSEVQPGARRVAQLREQLLAAGPACVFSEPPLRPRLAETLSAGLPVKLAELDALGSRVPLSAQGYQQLLEDLANGLQDCLHSL